MKFEDLEKTNVKGEWFYIDTNRSKRCVCGVLTYFALDKNKKLRPINRVANGFTEHSKYCLNNQKISNS